MSEQELTSVLSEASAKSLEELFSLDPLKLTRSDRDQIVSELRRARVKWEEAKPAKGAPKVAVDLNMSLDDLGL
jgi:hypothetical protein